MIVHLLHALLVAAAITLLYPQVLRITLRKELNLVETSLLALLAFVTSFIVSYIV